jgi:NitT/TauT family transport system substrate-binding protein
MENFKRRHCERSEAIQSVRTLDCFVASLLAMTLLLTCSMPSAHAEAIKVGISKLIGYPGVPIAVERGYFKQQGIDAEMVYFDSAQPIAVAVASGDVQFGTAGMSASFYTLAGKGQLRLIASSGGDAPGFYNLAYIASNKAYDAGLKTAADLKGHTVAVTQVGTSLHYAIGGAAKRYGFTMNDITLKPLQSNTNVMAALSGGTVDAAVMPGSPILGPLQKGEIKLLNWVADVSPNLTGSATFTSTKEANEQGDTVKRFLIAYRHGMKDFHDAFTNAQGKRENGPTAPQILDIMARFTGVAAAEIEKAIPHVDAEGRIDAGSVADQIAWYKSQGLLKGEVDAHELIDSRYAIPLLAGAK